MREVDLGDEAVTTRPRLSKVSWFGVNHMGLSIWIQHLGTVCVFDRVRGEEEEEKNRIL